jgi:hypothetical protein
MFQADRAILDSHEISTSAYVLFCYYCKFGGRDNPTCTASLGTAARDLKRDYTYLTRLRKELIAEGWILLHGGVTYLLKGIEEYTEGAQKLVSEVAKIASQSCENSKSRPPQKLRKQQVKVAKTASQSCENSKSHIKAEPAQLTSPINQQKAIHTPQPRRLPDLSPEREAEIREVHAHYCAAVETVPLDSAARGTLNRAVGEKGVAYCKKVIDGCALDDWPDRKFNNSIQFIFKNAERMGRLEKIARAKGNGNDKRNQPQPAKRTRADTINNRDYSWARGGDGGGGEDDGPDSRPLPNVAGLAAPTRR